MASFSAEFGTIFSAAIGLPEAADTVEVQAQISSEPSAKDTTTEYKETKKLAKRIIKAVQASLEDAVRKESELCRKPFEKELRDLDLLLQNNFLSRRDSLANSLVGEANEVDQMLTLGRDGEYRSSAESCSPAHNHVTNISEHGNLNALSMQLSQSGTSLSSLSPRDHPRSGDEAVLDTCVKQTSPEHIPPAHHQPTPEDSSATSLTNGVASHGRDPMVVEEHLEVGQVGEARPPPEPLTPALSSEGDVHPFANGGIPWYMVPFDPVGTTIEEERWTGRDLVRGMSEELSDMDEEQLSGLVDMEIKLAPSETVNGTLHPEASAGTTKRRKAVPKRKRWRGYR